MKKSAVFSVVIIVVAMVIGVMTFADSGSEYGVKNPEKGIQVAPNDDPGPGPASSLEWDGVNVDIDDKAEIDKPTPIKTKSPMLSDKPAGAWVLTRDQFESDEEFYEAIEDFYLYEGENLYPEALSRYQEATKD